MREHLPDAGDERHRRKQQHEADQRALDHDLAAEAIAEPAPGRRQQRRQSGRDAEAHAGPHRDLADVGDAQLSDEQRQKRHHQREAGVAHERRGGDREHVAAPGRRHRGARRVDGHQAVQHQRSDRRVKETAVADADSIVTLPRFAVARVNETTAHPGFTERYLNQFRPLIIKGFAREAGSLAPMRPIASSATARVTPTGTITAPTKR